MLLAIQARGGPPSAIPCRSHRHPMFETLTPTHDIILGAKHRCIPQGELGAGKLPPPAREFSHASKLKSARVLASQ
jgi:hypothetical protein